MDDFLDDFIGYDFIMGADEIKCPHCGVMAPCNLFFGLDKIECHQCGQKFNPIKKLVLYKNGGRRHRQERGPCQNEPLGCLIPDGV